MGNDAAAVEGQYPNVLRAVLAMPWAIDHDSVAWAAIVDVLALRSVGLGLTDAEIQARIDAAQTGPRRGGGRAGGGIGIQTIPVYGVISPRQNMMARTSGGTSAESILEDFRGAMADPAVDGIVLDIDSPGGAIEGIAELTAEIRGARGTKPVVAVANHMAASAAYWIASAADEIVATPSAMVGSIGVFTAHDDVSEAHAKLGVKRTVISAGKHKAEGALGQPLSDDARAHIQGQIDDLYADMTLDIAKGRSNGDRKVGVDTVRGEAWGEGRGVLARKALAAGMVERIDTLDNTVRGLARQIASSAAANAAGLVGDPENLAALASGLPYSERLGLASVLAADIAESSRQRVALRAEEGRDLSDATREGLAGLAGSLRATADELDATASTTAPDSPASASADPDPDQAAEPPRRVALGLLEAMATGDYVLPQT